MQKLSEIKLNKEMVNWREKSKFPQMAKALDTAIKVTERGELLRFFITELNKTRKPPYKPLTFPRMAKLVDHLSTQDLYFCKSSMLDLERNGKNASAWFYWSIKPK